MCFSAEASFLIGGALAPAGVYCVVQAIRKRPAMLGLAVVPLLFAVQQVSEGFVWLGLRWSDEVLTQRASLIFLLFALAVWPFWFPLQAAIMENRPARRWLLFLASLVSLAWFWVLFLPIARDPDAILTTRVVHHSIQYAYPDLPINSYAPVSLLRLIYFAAVALPFVISSERFGVWPGIVLGVSAALSAIVFHYAFVSVWCFFAAILAILCCILFHRLPSREERISTLSPAESGIR